MCWHKWTKWSKTYEYPNLIIRSLWQKRIC